MKHFITKSFITRTKSEHRINYKDIKSLVLQKQELKSSWNIGHASNADLERLKSIRVLQVFRKKAWKRSLCPLASTRITYTNTILVSNLITC